MERLRVGRVDRFVRASLEVCGDFATSLVAWLGHLSSASWAQLHTTEPKARLLEPSY